MRIGIILAIAGLAFLAGCKSQPDKTVSAPATPKWQGAAYHLSFDKPPAKPNPAGITIPVIHYTANPDALERRATLVVRFDTSAVKVVKNEQDIINQMIMVPVDVPGAEGVLPADYMDAVNKNFAGLLGAYCIKGKVKISVLLARSSLSTTASDEEIGIKRLSDWTPIELEFKNPHPAC